MLSLRCSPIARKQHTLRGIIARMRIASCVLVATVVLAISACDSKTDAKADSKGQPDSKGKATGDAPAKAGGSRLEFSMSAGPGLSVVPSECTIGADGKGVVKADGGKFEVTFEGEKAKLKWTYDGGVLDTETTVRVDGRTLNFNGMKDGIGFNGEITCA